MMSVSCMILIFLLFIVPLTGAPTTRATTPGTPIYSQPTIDQTIHDEAYYDNLRFNIFLKQLGVVLAVVIPVLLAIFICYRMLHRKGQELETARLKALELHASKSQTCLLNIASGTQLPPASSTPGSSSSASLPSVPSTTAIPPPPPTIFIPPTRSSISCTTNTMTNPTPLPYWWHTYPYHHPGYTMHYPLPPESTTSPPSTP